MAKTNNQAKANLATVPAPGDIRDRLKTYLDTIEESWFHFSVDASSVYDDELFKSWGYEKFSDEKNPKTAYVQSELPEVSGRVALWRVQIGQAIKKFGLTADQCSGMGWSKFKEIASLMLRDNVTEKQVSEWIEYAQGHTFKEVAEYVKRKKTTGGSGEQKEIVTVSHRYTDEQAKVIEKAEEKALQMLDLSPDKPINYNRASEFIHLFFLQNVAPEAVAALKGKLSSVPEQAKTPRKKYAQNGKKAKGKEEKKAPAPKTKAPAKKSSNKKGASKKG